MDHKSYLLDTGIFKKGNRYYHSKNNKEVLCPHELERLNKLKPPPAWTNVWYSSSSKCHIQVYGFDSLGKKQYILSQKWILGQKSEKYSRMKSLVANINSFKRKLTFSGGIITKDSIIVLLFNLLINTHIRVGNEIYALKNKTYGLTTLRQKHLIINDNGSYSLMFVGKSSIPHSIDVPQEYSGIIKKLILPKSSDSRNKPLFYYWLSNKMNTVSSEELNQFLKKNMGEEYTCKDFRTYSANILFIKAFLKNSKKIGDSIKKIVLKSIEYSANMLGHTRGICKKSYISDLLLNYCIDSFPVASASTPSVLLTKVWSS